MRLRQRGQGVPIGPAVSLSRGTHHHFPEKGAAKMAKSSFHTQATHVTDLGQLGIVYHRLPHCDWFIVKASQKGKEPNALFHLPPFLPHYYCLIVSPSTCLNVPLSTPTSPSLPSYYLSLPLSTPCLPPTLPHLPCFHPPPQGSRQATRLGSRSIPTIRRSTSTRKRTRRRAT